MPDRRNSKSKDVRGWYQPLSLREQQDDENDNTVTTEATTNGSVNSTSIITRLSESTNGSMTTRQREPTSDSSNSSAMNLNRRRGMNNSNYNRHQQLTSQIQMYLRLSFLSIILFLCFTLSLPSLFFLMLTTSTIGMAGRARYQQIINEVNQNGLLYYLPQYFATLLTNSTVHEFLTDITIVSELRFLFLYFIPGLSEEQLMDLVRQLPERRQEFLFGQIGELILPEQVRGHLYPIRESEEDEDHEREEEDDISNTERLLLADRENSSNSNNTALTRNIGIPRDLIWDESDINDNEVETKAASEAINDNEGIERQEHSEPTIPEEVPISPSSELVIRNQRWEQDGRVLTRAFQNASDNYQQSLTESISETILNYILTPTLLRRSYHFTSLLTFSTLIQWSWSAGILQQIGGNFNSSNPDARQLSVASSQQRYWRNLYQTNSYGRMLLSSTAFMGVSTGLLYYARANVRRTMQEARLEREAAAHPKSNKVGDNNGEEHNDDLKKDCV